MEPGINWNNKGHGNGNMYGAVRGSATDAFLFVTRGWEIEN